MPIDIFGNTRMNESYNNIIKKSTKIITNNYEEYKEYAQQVVDGDIVACKWIILACQRYLDMFDNPEYEFRKDKADHVIKFFSLFNLIEGQWANKPWVLTPVQKWILYNIFGFYHKGTDKRVIKKVLLLVVRKWSKTLFAAAIALYLMIFEDDGTQCVNVANSTKQAHILFRMEQDLLKQINKKKRFKIMRDMIKYPKKKSFCTVLSSDATTGDGWGCSFILDEVHQYKDSSLWDVLISGQGHLRNPLSIMVSTMGFLGPGYFLYDYVSMCKDILLGNKTDETQFAAIYTLDEGDDWKDESVWIKAQPHLDITVSREFMREQVLGAINNPALESSVRTKNFNQFISLKDVWIPEDIVKQHMIKKEDMPEFDSTFESYYGIDLASVSDLNALARCVEYEGKYYISVKCYIPYDSIKESANSELYKLWIRQGYLIPTDGNCTDVDYIVNDLYSESENFNVQSCGYDKWQSLTLVVKCTELGIDMEEFPQSIGAFSPFNKSFETEFKNGNILFEYNPIVQWAFQNCTLKEDTNGNQKVVKSSNRDLKIDPIIASIMAFGTYLKHNNTVIQSMYLTFNG